VSPAASGWIIGAAVGGAAGFAVIAGIAFTLHRHSKRLATDRNFHRFGRAEPMPYALTSPSEKGAGSGLALEASNPQYVEKSIGV
jgi:hypothetical protein